MKSFIIFVTNFIFLVVKEIRRRGGWERWEKNTRDTKKNERDQTFFNNKWYILHKKKLIRLIGDMLGDIYIICKTFYTYPLKSLMQLSLQIFNYRNLIECMCKRYIKINMYSDRDQTFLIL